MGDEGRRTPRLLRLAVAWLLAALALCAAPARAFTFVRAPRAHAPAAARRHPQSGRGRAGGGAEMGPERPAPAPAAVAGKLAMKKILDWSDAVPHLASIRRSAVEQFIAQYASARSVVTGSAADESGDVPAANTLTWGDELEYALMSFVSDTDVPGCYGEGAGASACNALRLALSAADVLPRLEAAEAEAAADAAHGPAADAPAAAAPAPGVESAPEMAERVEWHPEYGSWMVEATPAEPYGCSEAQLWRVHDSLAARRRRMDAMLSGEGGGGSGGSAAAAAIAPGQPGAFALSLTAFPLLGVSPHAPGPAVRGAREATSGSLTVSDRWGEPSLPAAPARLPMPAPRVPCWSLAPCACCVGASFPCLLFPALFLRGLHVPRVPCLLRLLLLLLSCSGWSWWSWWWCRHLPSSPSLPRCGVPARTALCSPRQASAPPAADSAAPRRALPRPAAPRLAAAVS